MTDKEMVLALYTFVAVQVPVEKMEKWTEGLDIIKKDIDALDILKNKEVDVYALKYTKDANSYNRYLEEFQITFWVIRLLDQSCSLVNMDTVHM